MTRLSTRCSRAVWWQGGTVMLLGVLACEGDTSPLGMVEGDAAALSDARLEARPDARVDAGSVRDSGVGQDDGGAKDAAQDAALSELDAAGGADDAGDAADAGMQMSDAGLAVEAAPVYVDDYVQPLRAAQRSAGVADADLDDTDGIQMALDECSGRSENRPFGERPPLAVTPSVTLARPSEAGLAPRRHCTVHFGNWATYQLRRPLTTLPPGTYLHSGLVLDGQRVTVEGHQARLVDKTEQRDNVWGDALDIVGLRYGMHYSRFQKNVPNRSPFYNGELRFAEDLELNDLTIETHPSVRGNPNQVARNCIGMVHAQRVTLNRVSCYFAHQTSFGAVSEPFRASSDANSLVAPQVLDLHLNGVRSVSSGAHAFRFIILSRRHAVTGALVVPTDMEVTMDGCEALLTSPERAGTSFEGVLGQTPVHLWYRAGVNAVDAPHASLTVLNSHFDASGQIVTREGFGAGVTLRGNFIEGGLTACMGGRSDMRMSVLQNRFACGAPLAVPVGDSDVDNCVRSNMTSLGLSTRSRVFVHGVDKGLEGGNTYVDANGAPSASCFSAWRKPFASAL